MVSARFANFTNNRNNNDFLMGFGMGYQVASFVDLKWWAFSPDIDDGLHNFGVGFGAQFRINE